MESDFKILDREHLPGCSAPSFESIPLVNPSTFLCVTPPQLVHEAVLLAT